MAPMHKVENVEHLTELDSTDTFAEYRRCVIIEDSRDTLDCSTG